MYSYIVHELHCCFSNTLKQKHPETPSCLPPSNQLQSIHFQTHFNPRLIELMHKHLVEYLLIPSPHKKAKQPRTKIVHFLSPCFHSHLKLFIESFDAICSNMKMRQGIINRANHNWNKFEIQMSKKWVASFIYRDWICDVVSHTCGMKRRAEEIQKCFFNEKHRNKIFPARSSSSRNIVCVIQSTVNRKMIGIQFLKGKQGRKKKCQQWRN